MSSATASRSPPPDSDASKGPLMVGVVGALLLLALIFFALRIYTRLRHDHRRIPFGWDDVTITISILLSIVCYVLLLLRIQYGFGRHVYYLTPAQIEMALYLGENAEPVWIWSNVFVKISMACMLLRIKSTGSWRRGLLVLIFFLPMSIFALSTALLFRCQPRRAIWDASTPNAKCWSPQKDQKFVFAVSIIFIACDIFFSLVPIMLIRKLNRPLRERIVVIILMGMGLLASAAAIFKLADTYNYGKSGAQDFLYVIYKYTLCAYFEIHISIIAACVPFLKSMFERILRRYGLISVNEEPNLAGSYATGSMRLERFHSKVQLQRAGAGTPEREAEALEKQSSICMADRLSKSGVLEDRTDGGPLSEKRPSIIL